MADVEIAYAGRGALNRARRAAEVLRLRLEALGVDEHAVDLVGVDSVLGAASPPLRGEPPEVRVHVSAACDDLARRWRTRCYAHDRRTGRRRGSAPSAGRRAWRWSTA